MFLGFFFVPNGFNPFTEYKSLFMLYRSTVIQEKNDKKCIFILLKLSIII